MLIFSLVKVSRGQPRPSTTRRPSCQAHRLAVQGVNNYLCGDPLPPMESSGNPSEFDQNLRSIKESNTLRACVEVHKCVIPSGNDEDQSRARDRGATKYSKNRKLRDGTGRPVVLQ